MRITRILATQVLVGVAVLALCLSVDASAGEVDAAAAQAFAKQNNCFRCHGIDKDKDGPAWKKISAKYKGAADAEAKLTHHLTSGEKAKFPDGHEEDHMILKSDDASEIKNLVDWILSL